MWAGLCKQEPTQFACAQGEAAEAELDNPVSTDVWHMSLHIPQKHQHLHLHVPPSWPKSILLCRSSAGSMQIPPRTDSATTVLETT